MRKIILFFSLLLIVLLSFICLYTGCANPNSKKLYTDITENTTQYKLVAQTEYGRFFLDIPSVQKFVNQDNIQSISATIYEIKSDESTICKVDAIFTYNPAYSTQALQEKIKKDLIARYTVQELTTMPKKEYNMIFDSQFQALRKKSITYYSGVQMKLIQTADYTYSGKLIEHNDKNGDHTILLRDTTLHYEMAMHIYNLAYKKPF